MEDMHLEESDFREPGPGCIARNELTARLIAATGAIERFRYAEALALLSTVPPGLDCDLLWARATRRLGIAPQHALARIIPHTNGSHEAEIEVGLCLIAVGRFDEAEERLRRGSLSDGSQPDPADLEPLAGLAQLVERRTRYLPSEVRRETYALLARGLTTSRRNQCLLRVLWKAKLHDGDLREAEEIARLRIAVLDALPCAHTLLRSEARLDLAQTLKRLEDTEAARAAAGAALACCPPWGSARLRRTIRLTADLQSLVPLGYSTDSTPTPERSLQARTYMPPPSSLACLCLSLEELPE